MEKTQIKKATRELLESHIYFRILYCFAEEMVDVAEKHQMTEELLLKAVSQITSDIADIVESVYCIEEPKGDE